MGVMGYYGESARGEDPMAMLEMHCPEELTDCTSNDDCTKFLEGALASIGGYGEEPTAESAAAAGPEASALFECLAGGDGGYSGSSGLSGSIPWSGGDEDLGETYSGNSGSSGMFGMMTMFQMICPAEVKDCTSNDDCNKFLAESLKREAEPTTEEAAAAGPEAFALFECYTAAMASPMPGGFGGMPGGYSGMPGGSMIDKLIQMYMDMTDGFAFLEQFVDGVDSSHPCAGTDFEGVVGATASLMAAPYGTAYKTAFMDKIYRIWIFEETQAPVETDVAIVEEDLSVADAATKALTAAVGAAKELLVAAGCGASRERRDAHAVQCGLDCVTNNAGNAQAAATCAAGCASAAGVDLEAVSGIDLSDVGALDQCQLLQQGLETAEAALSTHIIAQAASAATATASLAVAAAVAAAAMLF